MKECSSNVLALIFVVVVLATLVLADRVSESRRGAMIDGRERVSELALGLLLAGR